MIWDVVYTLLLVALFVRFQTTPSPAAEPVVPLPGEPLGLVQFHHRLFAFLLVGGPIEVLLAGRRPEARWLGALLFGAGVVLYRRGVKELAGSLSPFVLPKRGAALVTTGLYRWLRHPMFLGQALIAVGAPLCIGARLTLGVSFVACVVLFVRAQREEEALRRRYPEYESYTSRSWRFLPYVH